MLLAGPTACAFCGPSSFLVLSVCCLDGVFKILTRFAILGELAQIERQAAKEADPRLILQLLLVKGSKSSRPAPTFIGF